jgi:hypothetical protein
MFVVGGAAAAAQDETSASGHESAAPKPGTAAVSSTACALATLQLPRQHLADRRLLLSGKVLQHRYLVVGNARPQLSQSHSPRQDGLRIGTESLFDRLARPQLQRLGHQLLASHPLAERGLHEDDLPCPDGGRTNADDSGGDL